MTTSTKPLATVLLADDSPLARRMLADALLTHGLTEEVVEADNGRALIAAYTRCLEEQSFVGLIVVDVEMPGLDGLETARILRALEKAAGQVRWTPILFVSAEPASDSMRRFMASIGAAAYVDKGCEGGLGAQAARFLASLEAWIALDSVEEPSALFVLDAA